MNRLILIIATVLMLTGMLFAQPGNMMNPNDHMGRNSNENPKLQPRLMDDMKGRDLMQEMNLTAAQKTKLEDLRTTHQKAMNLLDAEIENLHMDIMQAIKKEDFVNAKKLNSQIFDKKLTRANARIDHVQMVMKELTPEQKEIGREMFMNMMDHGGKGMHQGMQGKMRDCKQGMQQGMHRGDCQGMMQDCGQGKELKKDCENHKDPKGNTNEDKPKMKMNN